MTSAVESTSSARSVTSRKLPSGVATTYNVPGRARNRSGTVPSDVPGPAPDRSATLPSIEFAPLTPQSSLRRHDILHVLAALVFAWAAALSAAQTPAATNAAASPGRA